MWNEDGTVWIEPYLIDMLTCQLGCPSLPDRVMDPRDIIVDRSDVGYLGQVDSVIKLPMYRWNPPPARIKMKKMKIEVKNVLDGDWAIDRDGVSLTLRKITPE